MPRSPRRLLPLLLLGASCSSLPDQPYPWPGTVSISAIPRGRFDWTLNMHAYSMPDPDGIGSWYQLSFDPVQAGYLLYSGAADGELNEEGESELGEYSFSRDAATFGVGYGWAYNLGDRVMVFSGVGFAFAYEHQFDRDYNDRRLRYEDDSDLHYLTGGPNFIGGVQFRATPDVGVEVGYQSFYERVYAGIAFPF